jgi:hypothetical protein
VDQENPDDRINKLAHDVRQCLQVIGLATNVLRGMREHDGTLSEVCELLDGQRKEMLELIDELFEMVRAMTK